MKNVYLNVWGRGGLWILSSRSNTSEYGYLTKDDKSNFMSEIHVLEFKYYFLSPSSDYHVIYEFGYLNFMLIYGLQYPENLTSDFQWRSFFVWDQSNVWRL